MKQSKWRKHGFTNYTTMLVKVYRTYLYTMTGKQLKYRTETSRREGGGSDSTLYSIRTGTPLNTLSCTPFHVSSCIDLFLKYPHPPCGQTLWKRNLYQACYAFNLRTGINFTWLSGCVKISFQRGCTNNILPLGHNSIHFSLTSSVYHILS